MTPVRARALLAVAVLGAIGGWGLLGALDAQGFALPVSWTAPGVIALVAVVVLAVGWPVRRWVRAPRETRQRRLDALRAARTVALAQAASTTGAALVGVYVGVVLVLVPTVGIEARRADLVRAAVALACALLLLLVGVVVERWCRLPPGDDDDGGSASSPVDDSLSHQRPPGSRGHPGQRERVVASAVGVLVLLSACTSGGAQSSPTAEPATPSSTGPKVVVGAGSTTEMALLQQLYVQLLQHAGFDASAAAPTDRTTTLRELAAGRVQVAPDYAHVLAEALGAPGATAAPSSSTSSSGADSTSDLAATMAQARQLARPRGLELAEPARASHEIAFVVRRAYAQDRELTSLSDLAALGQPITVAATSDCAQQPTCEAGLEATYGFTIAGLLVPVPDDAPTATAVATSSPPGAATSSSAAPSPSSSSSSRPTGASSPAPVTPLTPSAAQLVKQYVQTGVAVVGVTTSTDDTLVDYGLVALTDDRHLQPAQNVVPVVSASASRRAAIAKALDALAPVLTTEDLAQLDGQVDGQGLSAPDVARSYLKDKNLI